MVQSMPASDFGQKLVSFLNDQRRDKADLDLTISGGYCEGGMQIRGGEIVSAFAGPLSGNGAVMTLALMDSATFSSVADNSSVAKTVYITPDQIDKLLAAVKGLVNRDVFGNEERLLEDAKYLFFQYRFKEAGEKIVAILKTNRFYYPAWLWQSRMIRKSSYISKALDEAYRWGNHDQEIWREARKMRPQLVSNPAETSQRCFFCWSILSDQGKCSYCHAHLSISGHPDVSRIRSEDIKQAVAMFEQAFRRDPQNARVAYSLGVAYFNLNAIHKAAQYLHSAVRLSPKTVLFRKGLNTLGAILKLEKQKQQQEQKITAPLTKQPATAAQDKTIFIIEDSRTSRKALAMVFARSSYKIVEASTGQDALVIARVQEPDLIILDAMLPDTSGLELLKHLKNIGHLKNTPVIMLTGTADSVSRSESVNAGANECVVKPFNPESLIALTQKYLHPASSSRKVVTKPAQNLYDAEPHKESNETATQPVARHSGQPASVAFHSAEKDTKKSIFIIEDSPTSRKVLSMVLGRNGFSVVEAGTGQEALALAASIKPALVLLDVMLPDMTGYDVLPRLREIPYYKELPVVMLTGRKGSADRMRGMMLGTNEYLTKPFNPEKLISVIKNYIDI